MISDRRRKLRNAVWAATALLWIGLFTATHVPAPKLPDLHVSDKTEHFVAYFLLAAMIYLSTWLSNPSRRWTGAMVLAIAMVYGAIDEILQIFVNRHADANDWLADVAGATCAVVLLVIVRQIVEPQKNPTADG